MEARNQASLLKGKMQPAKSAILAIRGSAQGRLSPSKDCHEEERHPTRIVKSELISLRCFRNMGFRAGGARAKSRP
jgi:hypothetical protein